MNLVSKLNAILVEKQEKTDSQSFLKKLDKTHEVSKTKEVTAHLQSAKMIPWQLNSKTELLLFSNVH